MLIPLVSVSTPLFITNSPVVSVSPAVSVVRMPTMRMPAASIVGASDGSFFVPTTIRPSETFSAPKPEVRPSPLGWGMCPFVAHDLVTPPREKYPLPCRIRSPAPLLHTEPERVYADPIVTSLSIFSSPHVFAPASTVRPGTAVAAPVYHSVPGPTTQSNADPTNDRSEIVVVPLPETSRPPKPASVPPRSTVPPPVAVGFVFSVWSPVTASTTFVVSPDAAATVSAGAAATVTASDAVPSPDVTANA